MRALHEIRSHCDGQYPRRHTQLTPATTIQLEWSRRISPTDEQANDADINQLRCGARHQPQPRQRHSCQQGKTKIARLRHGQNTVLDEAAAAREWKDTLHVVRIRTVQRIVIVVEHVHTSVCPQREKHRDDCQHHIEIKCGMPRHSQPKQRCHQTCRDERRTCRREIASQWILKSREGRLQGLCHTNLPPLTRNPLVANAPKPIPLCA